MGFGDKVNHMEQEQCRYGCGLKATHFCQECADGASGLSGYFCEIHAARHDQIVDDGGGTQHAQPLAHDVKPN